MSKEIGKIISALFPTPSNEKYEVEEACANTGGFVYTKDGTEMRDKLCTVHRLWNDGEYPACKAEAARRVAETEAKVIKKNMFDRMLQELKDQLQQNAETFTDNGYDKVEFSGSFDPRDVIRGIILAMHPETRKREPGFYWIKREEKLNWIVAEYDSYNHWWLPSTECATEDWELAEIDERRIVRDVL